MKCIFAGPLTSDCRCQRCGRPIGFDVTVPPFHRQCEGPLDRVCGHLRELLAGEVALIPCAPCRGNVRQKKPVHGCAVFGKCCPVAPYDNPSGVKGCQGCLRFAAL